jgi:hypothetical protein
MLMGRISGVYNPVNANFGGDLVFETHQENTAQLYERLRIRSTGDIGMKTDNPRAHVQINPTAHSTAAYPALSVNATSANWTAINAGSHLAEDRVVLGTLSGKATIGGHNNPHTLWSDLIINPATDGRVGVGTQAPTHKFHVSGDVNVSAGTYRLDGLPIQVFLERYLGGSTNLAQVPNYLNWTEIGYIDLPHAGLWRLTAPVRLYFSANDFHIKLTISMTSGVESWPANTISYYQGNVGTLNSDPFPVIQGQGIFRTTGPQRIYLNAMIRHVSGGSPNIYMDWGYLQAFRVQ